jgi:hypothetical protein
MTNVMNKLKKLNTSEGVPFMDGREKGAELPKGSTVHIDGYGFIKAEFGDCAVISLLEFPENFFFGGQVVTQKMRELDEALTEEEKADAMVEGLPVLFNSKANKDKKKTYTTIEFYPDEVV